MSLMTRKEFIRYRDDHALEQMIDRKYEYECKAADVLTKAQRLRKRMDKANKREKELLEPQYDDAMKEWAVYECAIGNIVRDERYIRHIAKQSS